MNCLPKYLVTTFLYITASANFHDSLEPLVLTRSSLPSNTYNIPPTLLGRWLYSRQAQERDLSLDYQQGTPRLLGTQSLVTNIWDQPPRAGQEGVSNYNGQDRQFEIVESEGSFIPSQESLNGFEAFYKDENNELTSVGKVKITQPSRDLRKHEKYKENSINVHKTTRGNSQKQETQEVSEYTNTSSSKLDQTILTHANESTPVIDANNTNALENVVNLPEEEFTSSRSGKSLVTSRETPASVETFEFDNLITIIPDKVNESRSTGNAQNIFVTNSKTPASAKTLEFNVLMPSIPGKVNMLRRTGSDRNVLVTNSTSSTNSIEYVQLENQNPYEEKTLTTFEPAESLNLLQPIIPDKVKKPIEKRLQKQDDVRAGLPPYQNINEELNLANSDSQENLNLNPCMLLPIIPDKIKESVKQILPKPGNAIQDPPLHQSEGSNVDWFLPSYRNKSIFLGGQSLGIFSLFNTLQHHLTNTFHFPDFESNQAQKPVYRRNGITRKLLLNEVSGRTLEESEPLISAHQQEWTSDDDSTIGGLEGRDLNTMPSTLFEQSKKSLLGFVESLQPQTLLNDVLNLPQVLQNQGLASPSASPDQRTWLTPLLALRNTLSNSHSSSNQLDIPLSHNLENVVQTTLLNRAAHSNEHNEVIQDLTDVIRSLNTPNRETTNRRLNLVAHPQEELSPRNLLNTIFSQFTNLLVPHMKRMILEFQKEPNYFEDTTHQSSLNTRLGVPATSTRPVKAENVSHLVELLDNARLRTLEDEIVFDISPEFFLPRLNMKVTLDLNLMDFTKPNLQLLGLFDTLKAKLQEDVTPRSETKLKRNAVLEYANKIVKDVTEPIKSMVPEFSTGVPDFVSVKVEVPKSSKTAKTAELARSGSIDLKKLDENFELESGDIENVVINSQIKRALSDAGTFDLTKGFSVNLGPLGSLFQNKHATDKHKLRFAKEELKEPVSGKNLNNDDKSTHKNIKNQTVLLHLEESVTENFMNIDNTRITEIENQKVSSDLKEQVTENTQNLKINDNVETVDYDNFKNNRVSLDFQDTVTKNSANTATIRFTNNDDKDKNNSAHDNIQNYTVSLDLVRTTTDMPDNTDTPATTDYIDTTEASFTIVTLVDDSKKPQETIVTNKKYFSPNNIGNDDPLPGNLESISTLTGSLDSAEINNHNDKKERSKRFLPSLNTQVSVTDLINGGNMGRSLSLPDSLRTKVTSQSQAQISKKLRFGIKIKRSLSPDGQTFQRDCISCQEGSNAGSYGNIVGHINYGYTGDQTGNYGGYTVENVYGRNGEEVQIVDLNGDSNLLQPKIMEGQLGSGLLEVLGDYIDKLNNSDIIDEKIKGSKENTVKLVVTHKYTSANENNDHKVSKVEKGVQQKDNGAKEITGEIINKDKENIGIISTLHRTEDVDASIAENMNTTQNLGVSVRNTDNVALPSNKNGEKSRIVKLKNQSLDLIGNYSKITYSTGHDTGIEINERSNHDKNFTEQNFNIGEAEPKHSTEQIDTSNNLLHSEIFAATDQISSVRVLENENYEQKTGILDFNEGIVINGKNPNLDVLEEHGGNIKVNDHVKALQVTGNLPTLELEQHNKLPEVTGNLEATHQIGGVVLTENLPTFVVTGEHAGTLEVSHHTGDLILSGQSPKLIQHTGTEEKLPKVDISAEPTGKLEMTQHGGLKMAGKLTDVDVSGDHQGQIQVSHHRALKVNGGLFNKNKGNLPEFHEQGNQALTRHSNILVAKPRLEVAHNQNGYAVRNEVKPHASYFNVPKRLNSYARGLLRLLPFNLDLSVNPRGNVVTGSDFQNGGITDLGYDKKVGGNLRNRGVNFVLGGSTGYNLASRGNLGGGYSRDMLGRVIGRHRPKMYYPGSDLSLRLGKRIINTLF